jgi:hypothetical protein
MATLTIPQIAQLAINAGVQQGNNLYICVSIAMAESHGQTDAVNHNNDGTQDVGVWQINDVHRDLWAGRTDDRTDPVQNAKYMYSVSNGGNNWQPWTTYQTAAYNTYMQQVMSQLQNVKLSRGTQVQVTNPSTLGGGYGVAPSTTQVLNLGDIPGLSDLKAEYQTIDKFFKFVTSPDGWVRIMKVGIGIILIITGVAIMMKSELRTAAVVGAKVAAL